MHLRSGPSFGYLVQNLVLIEHDYCLAFTLNIIKFMIPVRRDVRLFLK